MPAEPPPRIVTLVLASAEGYVMGRLPPFLVDTPWWQDARPVVAGARARFGLDVTILRLLETELPSAHGGAVTYLAEADPAAVRTAGANLGLRPWHGALTDEPLRLPYASPGGRTWCGTIGRCSPPSSRGCPIASGRSTPAGYRMA